MSEWIEWHGGEQPVADDVVVEIRLRNGSFEEGYPAQFLRWHNAEAESKDSVFDIIAYRIVSQDSELDRLRKENAALREDAKRETGWLIECKHGTGWWTGRVLRGVVDCRFFSHEPNEAVRFARKEDAERVIAMAGTSCQCATGHEWLSMDAARAALQGAKDD